MIRTRWVIKGIIDSKMSKENVCYALDKLGFSHFSVEKEQEILVEETAFDKATEPFMKLGSK